MIGVKVQILLGKTESRQSDNHAFDIWLTNATYPILEDCSRRCIR